MLGSIESDQQLGGQGVRDHVPGVSTYGLANQNDSLTQLSVVNCWLRKLGIVRES
jgi:hypothetical protein